MNKQLLILSSSGSTLKEMWLQDVTAALGDFFLLFSSLKDPSESIAQVCLLGFFFLIIYIKVTNPTLFQKDSFLPY